ncbi:HNH endonuclease [Leuconostoc citreum]|uniref:HNH endonuclease n=1 Tax=Leuconostoc citreum TaxID=33964 RepID=UPI000BFF024C|nr:HNH endonuclease [Leuconostoc citreum]
MFCGQKKTSSLERVIPKAIGNKILTTNDVCKECNSALGQTIDRKFLDYLPIAMKRETLGLEGYKGGIPQVLKEGTDSSGNKLKFYKDSDPQYVPKIFSNDNGFNLIANSKNEAIKMSTKSMKRKHISQKIIDTGVQKIQNATLEENNSKIKFSFTVDKSSIEPEFLKIAFEYMNIFYCDTYEKDPIGIALKNILNQLKSGGKSAYSEYVKDISSDFKKIIRTEKAIYHRILPIIDSNNRLFIAISLFNREFELFVLVSQNGDNYPEIINKKCMILVSQV